MARSGGYRRSAVWKPCGVTPHAALENKSVVCSGSRVTISTVMKLRWSVKRGGIIVKRIQRALAHILVVICILYILLHSHWRKRGVSLVRLLPLARFSPLQNKPTNMNLTLWWMLLKRACWISSWCWHVTGLQRFIMGSVTVARFEG